MNFMRSDKCFNQKIAAMQLIKYTMLSSVLNNCFAKHMNIIQQQNKTNKNYSASSTPWALNTFASTTVP